MLTPVAYLEARDPTRNIHRAYSLAYGQDIFGNWVVETTYGRIGGKGRTLVTVSSAMKKKSAQIRAEIPQTPAIRPEANRSSL